MPTEVERASNSNVFKTMPQVQEADLADADASDRANQKGLFAFSLQMHHTLTLFFAVFAFQVAEYSKASADRAPATPSQNADELVSVALVRFCRMKFLIEFF